jgi:MMPL family
LLVGVRDATPASIADHSGSRDGSNLPRSERYCERAGRRLERRWGFQNGNLESLLGFASNGGVTNWLPLFLFLVLFGLSMDYHVFILSRVRELYERGMTTDEAVRQGICTTAGTVTSAAVVMVGVFAVFCTLEFLDFKEPGFGLAAAILIDATIIRGVLLPASMSVLGDWNWYLPRWLEWLPRVGEQRAAARPPSPSRPPTRTTQGPAVTNPAASPQLSSSGYMR